MDHASTPKSGGTTLTGFARCLQHLRVLAALCVGIVLIMSGESQKVPPVPWAEIVHLPACIAQTLVKNDSSVRHAGLLLASPIDVHLELFLAIPSIVYNVASQLCLSNFVLAFASAFVRITVMSTGSPKQVYAGTQMTESRFARKIMRLGDRLLCSLQPASLSSSATTSFVRSSPHGRLQTGST